MESLNLLSELEQLPTIEDGATLGRDETMTRIRAMDRGHFAMEVSQGTEEALEALFQARNVRDDLVTDLREAHRLAFSNAAEDGRSVHEHYSDMVSRGTQSAEGFVSNLKGKVAELKAKDLLKEELPGSDVQLASSPTQQGWDLLLRLKPSVSRSRLVPRPAQATLQRRCRRIPAIDFLSAVKFTTASSSHIRNSSGVLET